MRLVAVVGGVKSVGDVVLTSLRAHGPSSWVGVDPQQGPVLWEDLLGRMAGTGDAQDAPVTKAGVAADVVADVVADAAADAAVDVAAGVVVGAAGGDAAGAAEDVAVDVAVDVVGGNLGQEGRALAHDGDDRGRDAVARARREKASEALKNVR